MFPDANELEVCMPYSPSMFLWFSVLGFRDFEWQVHAHSVILGGKRDWCDTPMHDAAVW